MFTGRRQGPLTSPRSPRTRKETGVLHPLCQGAFLGRAPGPGVDTHTQIQAPHTSPRHLNTISQDVETISILKGEKSGWPADSSVWIGPLQNCRSSLCGWRAVRVPGRGWRRLVSCPSPFHGHKPSFNIYFWGGSGGGVASILSLTPLQPVPHRKLSPGPDSCDNKQQKT